MKFLFLLPIIFFGCKSSDKKSSGDVLEFKDTHSVTQNSDGTWHVKCKDGQEYDLSEDDVKAQIADNSICPVGKKVYCEKSGNGYRIKSRTNTNLEFGNQEMSQQDCDTYVDNSKGRLVCAAATGSFFNDRYKGHLYDVDTAEQLDSHPFMELKAECMGLVTNQLIIKEGSSEATYFCAPDERQSYVMTKYEPLQKKWKRISGKGSHTTCRQGLQSYNKDTKLICHPDMQFGGSASVRRVIPDGSILTGDVFTNMTECAELVKASKTTKFCWKSRSGNYVQIDMSGNVISNGTSKDTCISSL